MKTRTPANNLKNFRRARAIKRLEARLKLSDKELFASAKSLKPGTNDGIVDYRKRMALELEHTKKIQVAKGGSL